MSDKDKTQEELSQSVQITTDTNVADGNALVFNKSITDSHYLPANIVYTAPTSGNYIYNVTSSISTEYEAKPAEAQWFSDILEIVEKHNIEFTTEMLTLYTQYLSNLKIKHSYFTISSPTISVKETFRDFYIQYSHKKFNEKMMEVIEE